MFNSAFSLAIKVVIGDGVIAVVGGDHLPAQKRVHGQINLCLASPPIDQRWISADLLRHGCKDAGGWSGANRWGGSCCLWNREDWPCPPPSADGVVQTSAKATSAASASTAIWIQPVQPSGDESDSSSWDRQPDSIREWPFDHLPDLLIRPSNLRPAQRCHDLPPVSWAGPWYPPCDIHHSPGRRRWPKLTVSLARWHNPDGIGERSITWAVLQQSLQITQLGNSDNRRAAS